MCACADVWVNRRCSLNEFSATVVNRMALIIKRKKKLRKPRTAKKGILHGTAQ